ncbi:MAG: aa3-type cytochrome c oxidase subunit IV [Caulobacteraceae bacterium]
MAQSGAQGSTDIQNQKATFHGFLMATVWTCGLMAQVVGLLTLAFAIGAGWWPGYFVFVMVGVVVGFAFRLSGVYWAVQVAFWILLGLGGLVVPTLSGAAG